ncbi:MAG TPA: hypothetical protein VKR55_11125 [Bradyrhizobium sp.]|uniref:hypothetical protein n=1 Tax=Bradyrhizobium sp. TaxID=376 RepID=UPI002BE48CD7|nr:hypothetical protein [Bradyrhizobium sp.]HLZ02689.1 hypothetical protein [Bradyrhizobium sp.]
MLLPLLLAACETDDISASSFFPSDDKPQPFPSDYKPEILAFMHTYLNNPVGVHDAVMAEPAQRTVGGRVRYVSCLRFSERQSDGSYREPRERAILFVDGRLDRVLPDGSDECAGAVYAPFPELQNMQR